MKKRIDVEWLWSYAWEMMERRVEGAKGPTRPGAEVSVEIEVEKRKRKESSPGTTLTLDRWLKHS